MSQTRQHATEISLPATPEAVWRALTETAQVETWYAPAARIDARAEGEYFVSWGPGMEASATIEIFEPNKHLRVVSERKQAGEPVRIAIDFLLEAAGRDTKLRLVHSGFLASADWDDEYNGTKLGWPIMLRILRFGLANHPGIPGRQRWLYATAAVSPVSAWRLLEFVFRGVVPEYSNEPWEFCAPWSEPGDGLVYAAFAEKKGVTTVSFHVVLYGDAAPRIEEAAADWKAKLDLLYGSAAAYG